MPGNVFINEVRIPLETIQSLRALRYRASGLSTHHKRRLEHLLTTTQGQVAIFEGDVLFCLAAGGDIRSQKDRVSEFLSDRIRDFNDAPIEDVSLRQTPERVIERLTFAAVSSLAASRGIFTIYGRTLFKPTPEEGKIGHRAVETTLVIEDGAIKIYFTPTLIALINIQDTYRQERYDLELVGLCQFRVGCDLANSYGSCPYVYPSRLGYYSQEAPITSLSPVRQQGFQNAYKECPRISEATKVILARAAKKATNTLAYPLYVVHSRLSKTDLQTRANTARLYRQETLMLPGSRWKWTVRWLNDIFGVDVESGPDSIELGVGSVRLPVRIILQRAYAVQGQSDLDYKAIWIPEQRVVNDKQDPRPLPQSGGWLFVNRGAYDRQDIDRPFDKVNPYLVVPNQESILALARTLMNVFSNGKYTSRARRDQEFIGINCPESQEKYNCQFVNVWDEEEGIFLVDGSEADYWRAVQDVKREWNRHSSRDSSRIAIVIIRHGSS